VSSAGKLLNCQKDAAHQRFKGRQDNAVRYQVDVDAGSTVLTRTEVSLGSELTDVLDDIVVCQDCHAIVHQPRSPINFVPDQAMVLLCNYAGFQKPEMTKVRPVVVLSLKKRNGFHALVAAISTSEPSDRRSTVIELPDGRYPFLKSSSFVKCEMVNTVRLARLFLLRGPNGRGIKSTETILEDEDMKKVRAGVFEAIGG